MAQNQTNLGSPTNPYGNSPRSLSSTPPPPEPSPEELAANFMKSQAGAQPAAQPAAEPSPEELAAQFMGQQQAEAAPIEEVQPAPQPVPVGGEGADLLTQFKASFAGNDTEKLGFLEKQYGAGNARVGEGGKLEFSKDGGKSFEKFNSKKFGTLLELFGGRALVKEAAMVGPELMGGATGGFLAAPTVVGTPAGVVGGAALARVSMTPAANRLADSVAQWMGIPQDGTRNKEMENVMEQSVEAMIPGLAAIGKPIAKAVGKRIPGTALYKEAEMLAKKADVFELDAAGKELLAANQQLKDVGLDVSFLTSQINTRSTPLLAAQAKVKDTKEIQSAIIRVGAQAREAIEGTARALSDTKLAAKARDGRIGEQVLSGAQALRTAEGAEIGAFKAKALANTQNGRLALPDAITEKVRVLTSALGFDPVKGTPPKDLRALGGQLGITKTEDLKAFSNVLTDAIKRGKDGTLRYSDLDPIIKGVGNLVPAAQNYRTSGEGITGVWSGLAKELRAFKNEAIEAGLKTTEEKLAFRQVNARYGALLENVGNIEKLVSDDMGSHIVVDQLLGKGKEAVGNAKALKGILEPATWEKLTGEWVEKLLLDFRNTKTGNYNAAGLSDYLNKTLGPEFMEVIASPKKLSNLKAALTVGQRVADTPLTPAGTIKEDMLKKTAGEAVTAILGSPFLAGKALINAVFRGGQKGEEQKAIAALVSDEGFRRYISGLPDNKRGFVAKRVDEMYDYMVTNNLMPPAKSLEIAKQASGRANVQNMRSYFGTTGAQPEAYQTPMAEE